MKCTNCGYYTPNETICAGCGNSLYSSTFYSFFIDLFRNTEDGRNGWWPNRKGSLFYHEDELRPEWETNLKLLKEITERAQDTLGDIESAELQKVIESLRLTLTTQALALFLIKMEVIRSQIIEIADNPQPTEEAYKANNDNINALLHQVNKAKAELCLSYIIEGSEDYRNLVEEQHNTISFGHRKLQFIFEKEEERIKRETNNLVAQMKLLETRERAASFIESRLNRDRTDPDFSPDGSEELEGINDADGRYKTIGEARVIRDSGSDSSRPQQAE